MTLSYAHLNWYFKLIINIKDELLFNLNEAIVKGF